MTNQEILLAINDIDNDIISDAAKIQVKKSNHIIKYASIAACFAICAIAAYGIKQVTKSIETAQANEAIEYADKINEESEEINEITEKESTDLIEESAEVIEEQIFEEAENATCEQAVKTKDSFGSNQVNIPVYPDKSANECLNITGEQITDVEAKAYFNKNLSSIKSSLIASGIQASNLTVSENGYCHICYDGTEGKPMELRQNHRDYLAYNDDELVAIIKLYKENGIIYDCPAFGATWFKNYDSILKQYKGQQLLYVYANNMEIIISPDNKVYGTHGCDVSLYFEGLENPYEYFYSTYATYSPQK